MKLSTKQTGIITAVIVLLAFLVSLAPLSAIAQTGKEETFNARPDPLGADNQFGMMLSSKIPEDKQMAKMKDLGVAYYRPFAISINEADDDRGDIFGAKAAGFQVILVVRNSGPSPDSPSQPISDMGEYKKTLKRILKRFQPALLVVENEQDAIRSFTGSVQDYLDELTAAVQVAHELNIPVADGGLSTNSMALLTLNDLMSQRQFDQAVKYARSAYAALYPDGKMPNVANAAAVQRFLDKNQDQINRAKALLNGYYGTGVDYVNFHWYAADRDSLCTTVRFLRKISGDTPVLTTEVGQRTADPKDTEELMQSLIDLRLPLVVWNSIDGNGPNSTHSLYDKNGNLNDIGKMFKKMLQEKNTP